MNHAYDAYCTVERRMRKQKLSFDGGGGAIVVGDILEGFDTGAHGTVDRITISSGAWLTNDAAGYVILTNVKGLFEDNETLTTADAGEAVANGANLDFENTHSEYEYYWNPLQTRVPCHVFATSKRAMVIDVGWTTYQTVMCWLPITTTIGENEYRVVVTSGVFAGNYTVLSAIPVARGHHYEVELKKEVA